MFRYKFEYSKYKCEFEIAIILTNLIPYRYNFLQFSLEKCSVFKNLYFVIYHHVWVIFSKPRLIPFLFLLSRLLTILKIFPIFDNFYPIIIIIDNHSRVILLPIPDYEEYSQDYINASFIDVSLILIPYILSTSYFHVISEGYFFLTFLL